MELLRDHGSMTPVELWAAREVLRRGKGEQGAVGEVLRPALFADELLHIEIDAALAKVRRLHLRDDRFEFRLLVKGLRVELLGRGPEHR